MNVKIMIRGLPETNATITQTQREGSFTKLGGCQVT